MSIRTGARTLAAALLLLGFAGLAQAQDAYPAKPIRVILPFPGGSATDVTFRLIMEQARPSLGGQSIIVEARPGAGAVVATNYVMGQAPDGYTLMVSTSSQTISTAKANPPFDVRKMVHIIEAVGGPLYISVNAQHIKATTLKEFIDYARANPGKINFGSYGAGSLGHLTVELFNRVARVNTVHVPFAGSAADALAVSNGTSDASMNVLEFILPQAQAGKVRILASTGTERDAVTPDIPGMRESGLPELNVVFWQGIAGPPGLPRDIVNKVNAAVNTSLKTQAVTEFMAKVKKSVYGGTPQQMTDIVNREVETWGKLIREANINID
jgi:tripartite-type tricarboxylate transporter receptor subunit TctC